jgi:NAD(P)H dehydrogenase (quinone)
MRVLVLHAPVGPQGIDHEAASVAATAARRAGHEVIESDLRGEGFNAVMSTEERDAYHGAEPLIADETRRHAEVVRSSEVLVFVYPTTLTTVSPLLKGWLERVLAPGVAFVFDERSGKVKRGLTTTRRIVGITVHEDASSSGRSRDNGRRVLLRALRLCTGLRTRTSWVELRDASSSTNEQRAAFLRRVEHRMATL